MQSTDPTLDPQLLADKRFISDKVAVALKSGGLTLGFGSAKEARAARRRMYYVIQQLAEFDRQQANQVVLKLQGRMIALCPKETLSSQVAQEHVAS